MRDCIAIVDFNAYTETSAMALNSQLSLSVYMHGHTQRLKTRTITHIYDRKIKQCVEVLSVASDHHSIRVTIENIHKYVCSTLQTQSCAGSLIVLDFKGVLLRIS